MNKICKRTLSLLLAVLMLCNGMTTAFAVPESQAEADMSDMGVAAGQGMGTLLNGLIAAQNEQESEICFISSVTMTDRTAAVELTAQEACTLVVAIYDETTGEMLGSGVAAVEAEQTQASVEINALSMPDKYLVKGFLLDENNKAVGRHFVTMQYTQAYETFMDTTPDDFDSEDTIFFDETDKEDNFAVLTDDVISGTVSAAMTWTYDAGTSTYTFANATAEVKALKTGDIFYYEYGDSGNEFLLFKVKTITVSGSTVTVAEDEDISLEEAFRFIRIDHGINEGSGFIDESQLPESLQREERVSAQTEIINHDGKITLSDSLSLNYKSSDNGGIGISGSVGVQFTAAAKLYYDMRWGKDYYEFNLEFSFKFNFTVSVSGKIQVRRDNFYLPLADIPIGPFVLEGKAYPVISFSVKIDAFKVEYTSSYKLYVSSESGGPQANTDSSKKWETDFGNTKIEIKIGVGCEFGVSLAKLVEVGFDVEAGIKVLGDPDIVGIHNDLHHDCDVCFSCEARLYAEGAIFLKIKLFTDKLSLRWDAIKLSYDRSKALTRFYISLKSRVLDVGSGVCPRKMIAVKFKIVDETNKPIANAAVSSATGVCDINGDGVFEAKEIKTAEDGIAAIWFRGGKHKVTVRANGYEDKTQLVEVAELGKVVTVRMGGGSGSGVTPGGDNDFDGDLADCNVGDIINFGSYPQSRVTDQNTLLKLEAKSQNRIWTAYPYYLTGVQTDYMYYLDLQLGSDFYRGVRFREYRTNNTGEYDYNNSDRTHQDDNGYQRGVNYWFRYEPLHWRVLNPYSGLVLSEMIIDAQSFHDNPINSTNNWAESSLRQWLNSTFMNDAFNGTEQKRIRVVNLETLCEIPGNSQYDAGPSQDKVFLLTGNDTFSSIYNFTNDSSRLTDGTDYAKCQGLATWTSTGRASWWTRSPFNKDCVQTIGGGNGSAWYGSLGRGYSYDEPRYTRHGVRPALQLPVSAVSKAPKKVAVQRSAETTSVTRTVQQGQTYTATQSGTVAGEEYVLLVRQAGTTVLAADDLYYIDQQTAVGDSVTFTYVPRMSGECTVEIFGDFSQPATYTVHWVVDDTVTQQQLEIGAPIVKPADPVKAGYIFTGWSPAVPATMPANDLTFTAQFEQITLTKIAVKTMPTKTTYTVGESFDQSGLTLTATYSDGSTKTVTSGFSCTGFSSAAAGEKTITVTYGGKTVSFTVTVVKKNPDPIIKIHNYTANKTVDYRTTITFSADIANPVDGASVHWFIDGQDKGTGETYTAKEVKQKFTVQAKYMKGNDILAESEVEAVKVKSGFIDKLIAFFRYLFGRLPVVAQEYLGGEIVDRVLP